MRRRTVWGGIAVITVAAWMGLGSTRALADQPLHRLKCHLAHTAQDGQPNKPFDWYFDIDLKAGRIDHVKATISDDEIGWHPRQRFFGPYAMVTRGTWQFHTKPFYRGHTPDQVVGSCLSVH